MADYRQYFQAVLRPSSDHMIEEFFALSGRYSNFQKETCFIRYLSRGNYGPIMEKLRLWQEDPSARRSGYVFVPALARQPNQTELANYVTLYHQGDCQLPFHFENNILEGVFQAQFRHTLDLFRQSRGRAEESIIRNAAIKLLYWIDLYFPQLFTQTSAIRCFPKFACGGTVKLPEYLFLCLLYQMGCDVLYVGRDQDVCVTDPDLLRLSVLLEEPEQQQPQLRPSEEIRTRPGVSIPRRPAEAPPVPRQAPPAPAASGQPLEYTELAKLALSVVMLQVYDQNDQCFKTGSGVIVNQSGYILTNFHVVAGGRYFGILLEEEQDVCYTDELIKYNQDLDLAILRMNKRRAPIPIWKDSSPLVRGQKVVAIGSPLGLFNTVSDGIISGFRMVGERSMIQFTAPTSHGSSGGALLDLYGNLIGIITGGFDDGQNLNLAVDAKTILAFSKGLL